MVRNKYASGSLRSGISKTWYLTFLQCRCSCGSEHGCAWVVFPQCSTVSSWAPWKPRHWWHFGNWINCRLCASAHRPLFNPELPTLLPRVVNIVQVLLLVDWQKTQLDKSHFLIKLGWKCSNTASTSQNPYFCYFIFPQLMFSAQDLILETEHKFSSIYDSKLTCAFVIPRRAHMYKYLNQQFWL